MERSNPWVSGFFLGCRSPAFMEMSWIFWTSSRHPLIVWVWIFCRCRKGCTYETETGVDKGADGDGANEKDLGENIKVLMMVEEWGRRQRRVLCAVLFVVTVDKSFHRILQSRSGFHSFFLPFFLSLTYTPIPLDWKCYAFMSSANMVPVQRPRNIRILCIKRSTWEFLIGNIHFQNEKSLTNLSLQEKEFISN